MTRGIITGVHWLENLPETLGHPDTPFLKWCELVKIQPVVDRENPKDESDRKEAREELNDAVVSGSQPLQIVEVVLLPVHISFEDVVTTINRIEVAC